MPLVRLFLCPPGVLMPDATSARPVLDREFLEIRARLLELAAAVDRLDRAGELASGDPRIGAIDKALDIVRASQAGRAERVQLNFSIPYEDAWRKKLEVSPR